MPIDIDFLRREAKRMEARGGSNYLDNYFRLPDGDCVVNFRLLPPAPGESLPFVTTRLHRLKGGQFHCPMVLVGDRWEGICPICAHWKRLWKNMNNLVGEDRKSMEDKAGEIKPNERIYWNAIAREIMIDGKTEREVGPKVLSIGKMLQAKVLRAWVGEPDLNEPGLGDPTDLENGRDFRIVKKIIKAGRGYPNYDSSKFLGVTPAGTKEQIAKWMGALQDLSALRKVESNDVLQNELDIHLGLKPDPRTEMPAAPSVTVPVSSYSRPATEVTTVHSSSPSPLRRQAEEPGESLSDEEFLAELRKSI